MPATRGLFKLLDVTPEGVDPFQLVMEVGKVTYVTTGSQATYRTQMKNIIAASVNLTGSVSPKTDSVSGTVAVPLGAVSSNAIVLTRSTSSVQPSAGVYSVVLYGYNYVTDGAA